MNDVNALVRSLGLTIVATGPSGKYPRAEPGPAQGYRYWAQAIDGGYRFGVQSNPKAELSGPVAAAFLAAGFHLMPKRTEAFIVLDDPLDYATDQGRAVMAKCEHTLGKIV